jgi:hypothetical protein
MVITNSQKIMYPAIAKSSTKSSTSQIDLLRKQLTDAEERRRSDLEAVEKRAEERRRSDLEVAEEHRRSDLEVADRQLRDAEEHATQCLIQVLNQGAVASSSQLMN